MGELRPGLAKSNRARKGAFSSLLDQVLTDPSALDALVFAYEMLPTAERLGMAEAVVQDAERPGPALASLLSIESEPALRTHLAGLLREHASVDLAFVSGTESHGEVLLRDVDRSGPRESLRIAWSDNEISTIEVKDDAESSFFGKPTRRATAMELLAPMLWRHLRRGGDLPAGVRRFARYF